MLLLFLLCLNLRCILLLTFTKSGFPMVHNPIIEYDMSLSINCLIKTSISSRTGSTLEVTWHRMRLTTKRVLVTCGKVRFFNIIFLVAVYYPKRRPSKKHEINPKGLCPYFLVQALSTFLHFYSSSLKLR